MKPIFTAIVGFFLIVMGLSVTAAPLDLNDVTWLWPVPANPEGLAATIAVASLQGTDGKDIWTDEQFADLIKIADSEAAKVGNNRIGLPSSVRSKSAWRIAAFRVDPTAPGGHEVIRHNFGEKPQIRLILQPVGTEGDAIEVHDIAVHLVYNFVKRGDGNAELPDRGRFQQIVADLDQLKTQSEANGATTIGRPLGVHPGLQAEVPGLAQAAHDFLAKHLQAEDLSAMALMGLDGPEPWIFVAMSKFPPGAENFGAVPFLPPQMLSFREGFGKVVPTPTVNNLNVVPSRIPMPADAKDRRGVATAVLFDDATIALEEFAVIGLDADGKPVSDTRIRNRDIPDIIADPTQAHFFNTDCLSCHTETQRRMRFGLSPGDLAFRRDGEVPAVDPKVLPQDPWNVRNLGWFPPSPFIGGGPTVPTVTQRTANETAEVVAFIEQHYRQSAEADEAVNPIDPPKPSLPIDESVETRFLDQGWTREESEDFYYLTQGSQLLPYLWFLNLEQAGNQDLLRANDKMRALGCIPQPPSAARNPDGLPIGFVRNSRRIPIEEKAALLGADFNMAAYPKTDEWLGFTCAVCHTAELTKGEQKVRIDGGAALFDLESFLAELAEAMRATADDDEKFARFEQRVKESVDGDIDTSGLRDELTAYTEVIEQLVVRNKAEHPYGLARLDAFGAILNQICGGALVIPKNLRPSNAPVSYPFLWDTPQLDWVQWNSSVEIPVARNVGEVLGVFAHVQLTGTQEEGQFDSSANPQNLHRLEVQLRRLRAPRWPEDLFGKIDEKKAEAGKLLFANNCKRCHNMRDDAGNFEMTAPNEFERSFIKTTAVPITEIRTDSLMVTNFVTRTAKPGALADRIKPELESPEGKARLAKLEALIISFGGPRPDFTNEVPASLLLNSAVNGVIDKALASELHNRTASEQEEIRLDLRGHRSGHQPPLGGSGYKARPLNGVWATAPYGHAGAVPNLYQWLLPQEQRVKKFSISDRDFDTKHVGFDINEVAEGYEFRTVDSDGQPIPGNSNQGHSGPGQTDFTDEERWQLIEYLKAMW